MSLFTAQLRASRHVTCLRLPQRWLLEKEEYYASVLERQAGTLLPLPLEQMCHLFYLKRATVNPSVLSSKSSLWVTEAVSGPVLCPACSHRSKQGIGQTICLHQSIHFLPLIQGRVAGETVRVGTPILPSPRTLPLAPLGGSQGVPRPAE